MRDVRMPKLGLTMEEGELSEWTVRIGDQVRSGQELATITTDKVETVLESPCGGTIEEILVNPGSTCNVGTVLCRIAEQ